ncbi:MAG TPA: TIGR03668 family PPOX class F420-dependent oxidoreductase [Acidimicrobiales bacterium]|jgi:PPOX class probable F420-dependent enzyme
MDEPHLTRFATAQSGHLATITPEGRPHAIVCCFALVGGVAYSAVDHKPKSTPALRRLANIEAHPWASLLADHYDDDWTQLWWVRIDGPARVLHPDRPASAHERTLALSALAAKYPQYRDSPPSGAVIALDAARWTSWP